MQFYESYLALLASRYPGAVKTLGGDAGLRARLSPNLLCPSVLDLPATLREQASAIVRAFWALRELPAWKSSRASLAPAVVDRGHSSALMSYDFHVDAAGQLRLIEINTNASMSLLADLLYEQHGLPAADFRAEILRTFLEEFRLACGREKPEGVAITDERPENQRLFVEFAMYQDLFSAAGLPCSIVNTAELRTNDKHELRWGGKKIDLVYNRHTDFYFQTDATLGLSDANREGSACVTPNPFEYRLLADKERLMELSAPDAIAGFGLSEENVGVINRALIRTRDIRSFESPEALWAARKKFFFKPMRSFGGKAAYRGSSITKGTFSELFDTEYVAQEYVPAPVVKVGEQDFKYDLRFYVYRDQVQLSAARLYQGQMTNSQTPGGGLAAIRWT